MQFSNCQFFSEFPNLPTCHSNKFVREMYFCWILSFNKIWYHLILLTKFWHYIKIPYRFSLFVPHHRHLKIIIFSFTIKANKQVYLLIHKYCYIIIYIYLYLYQYIPTYIYSQVVIFFYINIYLFILFLVILTSMHVNSCSFADLYALFQVVSVFHLY